jgi:hypothetical protein
MEPNWYINSTTGLVVLENGQIVEWSIYKNVMPTEEIDSYLTTYHNTKNGTPFTKKRKASMNSTEYRHYCAMRD